MQLVTTCHNSKIRHILCNIIKVLSKNNSTHFFQLYIEHGGVGGERVVADEHVEECVCVLEQALGLGTDRLVVNIFG